MEVLALTKWNTIRTMHNRRLLSLAFNCYHGQSPEALRSLFAKSSSEYNFRRRVVFSLPKPGSDILKKSISFQAAFLWNALDNSTRAADSLTSFIIITIIIVIIIIIIIVIFVIIIIITIIIIINIIIIIIIISNANT